MRLSDEKLRSFIRLNHFNPNADWSLDNPVLHFLLANERFIDVARLFSLMPNRINPNLCDGQRFGKKSLLILLTLLPSSSLLIHQFIDVYKEHLLVDYQDNQGRTALHYAVILGRADVVSHLIELGASTRIRDEDGLSPLDYLYCTTKTIYATLKTVDIEPERDINALRNALSDHYGRPLMIQGAYSTQCKRTVENLRESKPVLIKYIQGNPPAWSTFIGDNSKTTYADMFSFAKEIAERKHVAFSDIFVNQQLDSDEQEAFRDMLVTFSKEFSGQSVLEQCIAGHEK
ncbi:ankyrin repeat domain-containing protein [Legionella tunisiensis]|uniref:ankyrin repeat domain-containing protein n=1 Tax=Legionella tunisiensis TaxID=1034944 RepID=UPI0002DD8508|nr:ankyrin repeat domain-containing protein [Legionella tunisiensis]